MNDTRDLNHQSLKGLCNDFLNYIFIGLQWPASYCYQTKAGCCLPTTGKPAIDFFITGLQTYNSTTGKAVTKCTKSNFNITEVILLSISLKWHIKFLSGFSFSWSNLHLWSVYMIVWSEIWIFYFLFLLSGFVWCGNETIHQLSDLMDELNAYWSNIKCPSSNGRNYWKSSWKTYGVCSGLNQHDYFKTALELRTELNLLSIFTSNGEIFFLNGMRMETWSY